VKTRSVMWLLDRTIGSGYFMATLVFVCAMGIVAYEMSDRTYTADKLECDDRTVVGWVNQNDMLYTYRIGNIEKSVPMLNCTRHINAMSVRKSEMYETIKN